MWRCLLTDSRWQTHAHLAHKGLLLTAANTDRYNLRDGVVTQTGWCGEKKEK